MTRGRIVVVLNNEIMLVSTEFNGDMFYQNLGKKVIEGLKKVENEGGYTKFVEDFNSENFGYKKEMVFRITDNDYLEYLNMEDNYFDKWFSDYIYVKNLSDDVVYFISGNGKKVVLPPNEIGIFYYGVVKYDIKENRLKNAGVVTLREKLEEMTFDE